MIFNFMNRPLNNIEMYNTKMDGDQHELLLRKYPLFGAQPPDEGVFEKGTIVFNTNPTNDSFIGWVCIESGTPGTWRSFGRIE